MVFGMAFEIVLEEEVKHEPDGDGRCEKSYHFSYCDADAFEVAALVEAYEEG